MRYLRKSDFLRLLLEIASTFLGFKALETAARRGRDLFLAVASFFGDFATLSPPAYGTGARPAAQRGGCQGSNKYIILG